MKLTFGKHKDKTIDEVIYSEEDWGYIVWLDSKGIIQIPKAKVDYCKQELYDRDIMHAAIRDSRHSDWGNRD